MRIYDIIQKKKRGDELTETEILNFIAEYTNGNIPDYQVSALLMAICFKGMTDRETAILTNAISKSGDNIDLSEFGTLSVDKHSTGGVGDKTTLIVAPIAASVGCKLAKMSGRGLGHTGGTVDKLESFPGYNTSLTAEEFFSLVRKHGIAVVGQSGNLAPADKKLYALRDVTATVDSVPLIASSVMGKKLAAGAKSIVLDVKCGSGSFMKTVEEAETLARTMVSIAKNSDRRASALITNMDVPLGRAIGNMLEVKEAISVLKGSGPADLVQICIALSSEMIRLALGIDEEKANILAKKSLVSGDAYSKFKEWIGSQGGDVRYADDPSLFKEASFKFEIKSSFDAYINHMNAEGIGVCAMELGAGRKTKTDIIDFEAGIVLDKKTGDKVSKGDVIATLYTNNENSLKIAEKIFEDSIEYSNTRPEKHKLIYKKID